MASILFVFTAVISLVAYLLFEAPYRALFRYYLESPRIITFVLPVVNANGGKPNGNASFSKGSMLNLNPNFLFSPHYNLVTNISSRAESETSSLANYSLGAQPTVTIGTTATQGVNSPTGATNATGCPISKSISSVSMLPNGDIVDRDLNNNKHSGEAY